MSEHVFAIVGNPNCGKTTVYNALTGARQRVGNWSGVTVERRSGHYHHQGLDVEVVDLPVLTVWMWWMIRCPWMNALPGTLLLSVKPDWF